MLLHKYIDRHFVDVLRDLTLKVNDPEKFNDPFEFKPVISPFKNQREKQQYLNSDAVQDFYYKRGLEKGVVKNRKDFKSLWKNRKNNLLKTLGDMHAFVKAEFESVPVGDYLFVLCLSAEIRDPYDEVLMWSHYTEGHKGARLAIETACFRPPFFDMKQVCYSKDRPSFHIRDYKFDPEKVQNETKRSMYTKSIAWRYENEYRLYFAADKCKKINDLYFVDIKPEALREVIIGCKAEERELSPAMELLMGERFKHVKVRKAKVADDSYRLDYIDASEPDKDLSLQV